MKQNTDEWLEWRKKGLGASDAAVIMGISPYKTPFQLWEEKLGLADYSPKNTFILDKGHRLEPKARAKFEIDMGIEIPPILAQHAEYDWMRASMDGYNANVKIGGEIKYVGSGEKWLMAANGELPDHYMSQIQHQYIVTGADKIYYIAFRDTKDILQTPDDKRGIIMFHVPVDIKYCKKLLKLEEKFWNLIQEKKEPKLIAKDYKKIIAKDTKKLLEEFSIKKKEHKKVDDELSVLKSKILLKMENKNHARYIYEIDDDNSVKIITKTRTGSIDYKKILTEHLPDLDTSGYVKPSTTFKEVRL